MNSYLELMKKQETERNNFPMFFAFNKEQFEEGMRKLGLEPNDTGALLKLGDTGGFIRKDDKPDFSDMMERHYLEKKAAIDADSTGEGFIFEMFDYELSNHEYNYTRDLTDALRAVGLTEADIKAGATLKSGLLKAMKKQIEVL